MVSNNVTRFLVCFCFLCTAPFLAAQNAGFIMERRVAQRLAWTGDDLTLRYEVVIEKEVDEETFEKHLQDYTNDSFIMVSLSPGKYRYRIIPHDFLDQRGVSSEWIYVEVLPMLTPEIHNVSPALVYLKDGAEHTITVSGEYLFPDAEIFLRRLGSEPVFPLSTDINEKGNLALLLFENSQLLPGDYEIVIINPGGHEAHRRGITAEYPGQKRHSLVVNTGACWMPLIPFYGDAYGDNKAAFPGAAARVGLSTLNTSPISAGLEITASWYTFDHFIRYENAVQNGINLELNLMAKKPFPNQTMALIFRLGAGLSLLLNEQGSLVSRSSLWYTFNTNVGVSFQWLVFKPFYLEVGTDCINLLTDKNSSGAFRPWLAAGIQL